MKLACVGLLLLVSFATFANFDVTCTSLETSDLSMKSFTIGNFSQLLSNDFLDDPVELIGRDARQADPSYLDESGMLSVDLHNGCDNFYKLSVHPADFAKFLEQDLNKIQVILDYPYDESGPVLVATCVKQ